MLQKLIPKFSGHSYIRLGNNGDGGYVLPNDLDGVDSCFSPGVNKQIDFEYDLLKRFGIVSHLCDETGKRPDILDGFTYDDFWLAEKNGIGLSTLSDWVKRHRSINAGELILQMDIEGAEWKVLATAPDAVLERFRIIIVELHTLSKIASWRRFRKEVVPFFSKLLRRHYVAYLHANNCMTGVSLGPVVMPEILEITFHRIDRLRAEPLPLKIPTYLDCECVPSKPPLYFYQSWLNFLDIQETQELTQ